MISFFKQKLKRFIVSTVKDQIILQELANREAFFRQKYNLADTFSFGQIENIVLAGDHISIGENSYLNSGIIQSGKNSSVRIGAWCAMAYNVMILAVTHDVNEPTGSIESRKAIEKIL
ncbi:MAG: hypothetical protein AB8E82_09260 [Aureispira sp.]